MKKLFSIAILTTIYSPIYLMQTPGGENVRILQDQNEQFTICREINEAEEECAPFDIQNQKRIFHLKKELEAISSLPNPNLENNQKHSTLSLYLEIIHQYELTKRYLNIKKQLKSENNGQKEISEEEIYKLLETIESSTMQEISEEELMDMHNATLKMFEKIKTKISSNQMKKN